MITVYNKSHKVFGGERNSRINRILKFGLGLSPLEMVKQKRVTIEHKQNY